MVILPHVMQLRFGGRSFWTSKMTTIEISLWDHNKNSHPPLTNHHTN
jgi:hypothetical protein